MRGEIMDQKIFIQRVEEQLKSMEIKQLRSSIQNIAIKVSENKRENFFSNP